MNVRIIKKDEVSIAHVTDVVDIDISAILVNRLRLTIEKVCSCCGHSETMIYDLSEGERIMIF